MGTPDWKERYKLIEPELKAKEKEVQLLTSHLLMITETGKAMNNEIKRWVDVAEAQAVEIKALKEELTKHGIELPNIEHLKLEQDKQETKQ